MRDRVIGSSEDRIIGKTVRLFTTETRRPGESNKVSRESTRTDANLLTPADLFQRIFIRVHSREFAARSSSASPCLRGEYPAWKHAWSLFRAALREVFDESAYERFLLRTRAPRSRESYQAFMREKEAAAARRPRCC